jgi:cytoskeletal protein RodZ
MAENDPSHSELASFGEELRREREIRGISLKEISDATKISKRFLEAIERNDHRTLPAPVFTRGFVREYARYLGLNAEEMVTRYNYAAVGDDRIEQSSHLQQLAKPATTEAKGIPRARIDRNVVLLFVIVIALSLMTWWALRFKREARAEVAVDTASAVPVKPHVASLPSPPQAATTTSAPPTTAHDDLLHLTLDLTDDSWITLDADGKTVISDELQRGDHRTFDAHDSFRFKTIGNAGGVALTINGVRIGPLGKDGKVLHDRTFDREWVKKNAATPEGAHTTS